MLPIDISDDDMVEQLDYLLLTSLLFVSEEETKTIARWVSGAWRKIADSNTDSYAKTFGGTLEVETSYLSIPFPQFVVSFRPPALGK